MMKDVLSRLAQAFLYFFGILHIISFFFGAQVVQFGYIGSAVFLIIILGCGTIIVTWLKSPILCWVYGVLYVIGWAVEFTEMAQWVIPWRHDQYMLLTSMNAIAAVCLIYLAIGEKTKPE